MIKLHDFFEIDTNDKPVQKPINRNGFTLEDVKYKVTCIKAMQELGMKVTIDEIGNICGTIPGKLFPNKSIICGSHTDSVDDGGQFDGPLGVYAALKTAENIINSGKQNAVNYKAVIYACEESTRFKGKACLGSKYLRGDNLDFDGIISRDGLSLRECIAQYKTELFKQVKEASLKPLIEVDKVLEQDEIVTALEGHIEQADVLRESGKNIGLCTSITAPYRLKADVSDIQTASKFICDLTKSAKEPENSQKYRVTFPEFSIKNNYSQKDLQGKKIVTFRAIGERNHSGATPMDKRKDAVYGAAKFIHLLSDNPDVQFLETCTTKCGSNQINDCCDITFAINPEASKQSISQFFSAQKDASKLGNVQFEKTITPIKEDNQSNPGLFLDVRQQLGLTPELSSEMIFETAKDIVHRTNCNIYMNITAKGKPYQTNSDLVKSAAQICEAKKIKYKILKSWAGHDLATLTKNPNARTLLIFCDNSGGSHNPDETTTVESIETLALVVSELAQEELDRANRLYLKMDYDSTRNRLNEIEALSSQLGISFESRDHTNQRD